jgi:hypothetical protein
MSERMKLALAAVLGGVIVLVLAMFAVAALIEWARPTDRVLWQECQPEDVSYESFDPYCIAIVEGDVNWQFITFTVMRHFYVFVGRGQEISYGHYISYTPQFGATDKAEYLSGVTVEWTSDGVTLLEPGGHRLFIPADQFTGGR